ncbi:C4-dicarboxylate ABC transporter substrate-binding protein [Arthrobacter sp. MYb227]|uniref:TAXI family TRAP transporter solute-binding subunit n=1 Tax=Arthrobacter sp. MYb227 TaxID=1848601 RepID=UPI000CFDD83A|nr:TAXI family TRAP transporter solute-binding subunit [Arthrobacter sp. MYb227]PQZ94935.1 C4-dicarboxylate ABC transporter substrate-binding protein [Arthrobacter sp. MYb227]
MNTACSKKPLVSRRGLLKAGIVVSLSSALSTVLSACTTEGRPAQLTVAGGEPGGFYLEFSMLLAESLQRYEVAEHAVVVETGGSLQNLEFLRTGKADLAVALADAAAQQTQGSTASPGQVLALGKVYENYVHCVVRKDSDINSFAELAGKTVAVGQPGSGTSLITPRLFNAAGLTSATQDARNGVATITVKHLGLNSGIAALQQGTVDALFWSGGVPTAAIATAHRETGLKLLDLSALVPALRSSYGAFYDRVLIPADSYAGIDAVWTVGVANLLLCRADLEDRTVSRAVKMLVEHAADLIPRSSVGVQFLSPELLINTAEIPLHPAAAAAYRELHG